MPPTAFNVPAPKVEAPSLNVTVPVGIPAPLATFTVAVKVTEPPRVEGDPEVATAVVVVPWITFCVRAADVLPVKLPSPA